MVESGEYVKGAVAVRDERSTPWLLTETRYANFEIYFAFNLFESEGDIFTFRDCYIDGLSQNNMDLIAKFSVVEKVPPEESIEIFNTFLASNEEIILSYKHARDRVVFTSFKIICYDVQGMTGSKKEYRIFPYSKISSFSVETAGFLDSDSDFKIWISGVGVFEIKFSKKLDIKEVGAFMASKISK